MTSLVKQGSKSNKRTRNVYPGSDFPQSVGRKNLAPSPGKNMMVFLSADKLDNRSKEQISKTSDFDPYGSREHLNRSMEAKTSNISHAKLSATLNASVRA